MTANKYLFGLAAIVFLLKSPPTALLSLNGLTLFVSILSIEYAVLSIYKMFIYPYYFSPLRHLPGPKNTNPLLGHLLAELLSGNPTEPFLTWMRQSIPSSPSTATPPPLIRYFGPLGTESILVTSLEATHDMFVKHPYAFTKPSYLRKLLHPIIGQGLLFTEGEHEHLALRKRMNRVFGVASVKRLVGVFWEKARGVGKEVGEKVDAGGVDVTVGEKGMGVVVDLAHYYHTAALDIIGVATLGIDLGKIESKPSFRECYQTLLSPSPLGQALWGLSPLLPVRWLPLEENRKFKEANEALHAATREIIRGRIRDMKAERAGEKEKVDRRDLLSFMLEEGLDGGKVWDEEDLMGHVLNFLAGGHDTVATAVTWATHAMTLHPQVQENLRAEINEMFERNPEPGYTEIENLKLLKSFCKEVLRLYTPSSTNTRHTAVPVIIAQTPIPANTTVIFAPSVIHRNPSIWGPDCDEFKLERWDRSDTDELSSDSPTNRDASFIFGPRACIGRAFAIVEMKVLLIEMIRQFRFRKAPGINGDEDIKLANPHPVLKPKVGLPVVVERV